MLNQTHGLALALGMLACSAAEAPQAANIGGSPGAGSSLGVSGSSQTAELFGSFLVQVAVDGEDTTRGVTSVIGKVSDGPTPSPIIWEVGLEEGDCRLEKPRVPFCDPPCGSEVCVEEATCRAYPQGLNAGVTTLRGVELADGTTELELTEIAKAYQPPAGTRFAFPPFAEGAEVTLRAAGGSTPAFELVARGVAPLSLTLTHLELEDGQPLELRWLVGENPRDARMHLKLDISHHGGTRGMIQCDAEDTGSLTISPALVSALVALGVAGFPTVVVTRVLTGTAGMALGRLELEVSSKVEQAVAVPGLESCTTDGDCTQGTTCQSDLTCQ